MLREAKRYLRRQGRGSSAGSHAALTTRVNDGPPPRLSSPAAVAVQRVTAARAAALEEDAFIARMGAPRESLLSFREQRLGSFAGAEDGGVDGGGTRGIMPGGHTSRDDRKRWTKEDRERLDEIAPKATGRDASLEKRAAARQSNRDAAAAKDDDMLGGILGDELGGGDDFRTALARQRRVSEASQLTRNTREVK